MLESMGVRDEGPGVPGGSPLLINRAVIRPSLQGFLYVNLSNDRFHWRVRSGCHGRSQRVLLSGSDPATPPQEAQPLVQYAWVDIPPSQARCGTKYGGLGELAEC